MNYDLGTRVGIHPRNGVNPAQIVVARTRDEDLGASCSPQLGHNVAAQKAGASCNSHPFSG